LQSVIEQQEAANEELQSANEEVQSANEELQSINEELETSKEEVQSSNEELATVNDELNHRNLELAQANNDFVNLLASVQMAIVMVDSGLSIRRFTPMAEKMLNLIPADVGRPIRDLNLSISIPDLGRHLEEVIDTVGPKEFEVQDRQGRWHLLRLRPYRTMDNKIDGAVMVFVDIDSIKRDELVLRQQAQLLERVRDPILMWELDGPIVYWSKAAEEAYGYKRGDVLSRSSSELLSGAGIAPVIEEALRKKGSWAGELVHLHRDGKRIRIDSRMSLVREADGRLLVIEANHVIGEEAPRG
jgi:two-component system CheB/CheR fusion protein